MVLRDRAELELRIVGSLQLRAWKRVSYACMGSGRSRCGTCLRARAFLLPELDQLIVQQMHSCYRWTATTVPAWHFIALSVRQRVC